MTAEETTGPEADVRAEVARLSEELRGMRESSEARGRAHEAELAALRGELARMRSEDSTVANPVADHRGEGQPRDAVGNPGSASAPRDRHSFMSRRGLLLGGLGAVAGASAIEIATAGPAAAAAAMIIAADNQAAASATALYSTNGSWTWLVRNTGAGAGIVGTASSGVGVQGESSGSAFSAGVLGEGTGSAAGVYGHSALGCGVRGETDSSAQAAITGVGTGNGTGVSGSAGASGDTDATGVYGSSTEGTGVLGFSGSGPGLRAVSGTHVAVEAFSEHSGQLLLKPGNSGVDPTGTYAVGTVFVTPGGRMWFCVEGGTPGRWRLLASPDTAGGYVSVTPFRVYDSRWVGIAGLPTGLLTDGTNREIPVAISRDLNGAVISQNAVPEGATAVTVNLTIAGTQGGGYVTLVPGGGTSSNTSTINWSTSGQILSNGGVAPLNMGKRSVTFLCRAGNTHVILDITGYYLANPPTYG